MTAQGLQQQLLARMWPQELSLSIKVNQNFLLNFYVAHVFCCHIILENSQKGPYWDVFPYYQNLELLHLLIIYGQP